jgi:hypothetical protein
MDHASLFVEVLQGLRNLHNDVPREILAEVGQSDDLVEQLAAGRQLEDDVVVLPRLGKVDELDDVGVVELLHDLDFFQDVGPLRGVVSFRSKLASAGVVLEKRDATDREGRNDRQEKGFAPELEKEDDSTRKRTQKETMEIASHLCCFWHLLEIGVQMLVALSFKPLLVKAERKTQT